MKRQVLVCTILLSLTAFVGCGGGSSITKQPDFSLDVAPSTVTIVPGGVAQALSVAFSPSNGFNGSVAVTIGSLPSGVTASPATLSLSPANVLGQVTITASPSATPGTVSITVSGTSGALSHNATASLQVAPPSTTVSLSAMALDFGGNLVNNTLTQMEVVTNTGPDTLTLNPTITGDPSYSIASGTSCTQQLAAGANCSVMVSYAPTTASAPATQNATLNLGFGDVPADTPQTVAITGIAAALPAGQVTATNNPLVALYTMTLPFPGSMKVNFGADTNYGLMTWTQSTSTAGGQVSIFVAGMKASTAYHMQATVVFTNGITAKDSDHTFTTKALPAAQQLHLATTTTAGMTPQSGLELLNPISGGAGVLITDLSGNILWTYANPGNTSLNFIDGVKTLPNGDFLMTIGPTSSAPIKTGPIQAGSINEMREVNLAGDTVREITMNDLNAELATASCAECNVSLLGFHHDVEPLPNGHWLVLASTTRVLSRTSTPPLDAGATTVEGDVIVDLDQNLRPVWAWNEFNHLDPNRHPYMFPDWTHTNAIVYSKDDGDIIVSMRHQNWIIKVNYADGAGDGTILWRLGEGGDFTLKNGTDPTDWQYAQHAPSFFSANTAGVFSLGAMDNGDDRMFPAGVTCGASGAPPCLYTTIPVWQIDEGAKTATLTFHQILPPTLYNFFGGNTEMLANGNVEYDLCGIIGGVDSSVYEVTQESNPKTVWTMHVQGTNFYRAFRIPSFYPGVQW
jgi:arylsulfate sulfotransferase